MNDQIVNRAMPIELGGLSHEDTKKIFAAAERRAFKSGDILIREGDIGRSMFIVLFGRIRLSMHTDDGNEKTLNILQQGDHFGELALLIGSRRAATATAIMDSTVLEISKRNFFQIAKTIPDFSIKLSRTIGKWLLGVQTNKLIRHKLGVIGMVRTSELTSLITLSIARYFIGKGKIVEIFSDRLSYLKRSAFQNSCPVHALNHSTDDSNFLLDLVSATKRCDHVFIDVDARQASEEVLMQCERIWWLIAQNRPITEAFTTLAEHILNQQAELKNRMQAIWIQPQSSQIIGHAPYKLPSNLEDVHCIYNVGNSEIRAADLSRMYHIARDVHMGLALGGGGSHGLAHIGVVEALEEHGLYFDRVAGTSVGSIIAAGLGAGLSPKYMLSLFNNEMKPPLMMSRIPKISQFYLWTLFRFGLIEHRLRKYLHNLRLEHLLMPVHTISVDLISGQAVIRSAGDAVNCVLESINYPIFGKPIWGDGLALVDGGVLINVPSSVLRKQQANYIVAVDVGTKLHPTFGKNNAQTAKNDMKHVGYFSTLNRILEVSAHELAKLHMSESDFLITPDTSAYAFADFTHGEQLFEIGYNAAQQVIPELKQRYERFVEME